MQTFLPYSRFDLTARRLDRARLGKQRVEAGQILRTLLGWSDGWAEHPAVRMWRGYEVALFAYLQIMRDEWAARGYRNDKTDAFMATVRESGELLRRSILPPPWLGDRAFHLSHRSNLLRKAPEHYRQYWPRLRADLPYVWPTNEMENTV